MFIERYATNQGLEFERHVLLINVVTINVLILILFNNFFYFVGKEIYADEDKFGDKKTVTSPMENFSLDELSTHVPKIWHLITKSPIIPSLEEQNLDPSLKLVRIRAAYKLNV